MVDYTHHSPLWQKEEVMEQENYGTEQELEETACPEEVTEEVAEAEAAEELPAEETTEESVEETEEANEETAEEVTEEPKKKPMKLWQVILAGVGAGLLLIALALLLLHGMGFELVPKKDADEEPSGTPAYTAANDYTGDEAAVEKAADTVVATVGDKELTNKNLQVYFNIVVNDFVMNYYSYLSEIGLDYTKPLNEQKCYFEQDKSWEEYFVDTAIETWVSYQSIVLLADEDGYKMDADTQQSLNDLPAQLDEQAKEAGYESADALLKEQMNCTMAEYVDYWTMYEIGVGYTNQKPAAAEVEKFFKEHKEDYEASGITKDSGPIVDVRHILIQPEGGETDESGKTTYSDAAWKACKAEAEKILKEWKNGKADEASFAALANEKSADGGSNTTGGLYEGITEDANYVEPFLKWCMDKKNKKGDTGIVKTEFGYHIMFMSATEEYWFYAATMDYLSERTETLIAQAKEKWPPVTDISKVCLKEVKLY